MSEQEPQGSSQAEVEALREELRRAHLLFDAAPGLLYIYDLIENRNVFSNRQMGEMLGYSAEEIRAMGATFLPTIIHPDDWAETPAYHERLARTREGEVLQREYRVRTAGGDVRWFQDRTRIIDRTPDGSMRLLLGVVEDITERKRLEEEQQRVVEQALVIESQQAALRELGAPLIPIAEGVIAMPLIGVIDAPRAQHILETLLEGITARAAAVVILDITGVHRVDAQVADGLAKATRAAGLLGAEVVLTGVGPEVARTMVELDLSLGGLVTRGSFQDGIAHALTRTRKRR